MKRGFIIPIGGAEEKMRDSQILLRFVDLCGGKRARIAVIATASQLSETGEKYRRVFLDMGAHKVRVLPFEQRADCEDLDRLEKLERADGVFFTGGNQLRLATTIGGTSVADLLRRRNKTEGLHVAGTSAGASFLSEHMIANGEEGPTPRSNMVTLSPGLGLTRSAIIDQHFRQRDRMGRLLTAVAYNPRPIGIGLDEDTAAFLGPDDILEVVGSGAITIVDPSEIEFSSIDSVDKNEPICLIGSRIHVLTDGASYDIPNRKARAKQDLFRSA